MHILNTHLETHFKEIKNKGTSLLIALMARNEESQRFYGSVENSEIHDEGIWMYL